MTANGYLGHLTDFSVSGLFGEREFSFRLDLKEPTILTGTNGSGKSTVLRILDAIGTGAWGSLWALPFEGVSLTFESGTKFTLTKSGRGSIEVHLDGADYCVDPDELLKGDVHRLPDEDLASMLPELVVGPHGLYDGMSGRFIEREEAINRIVKKGIVLLNEEHVELGTFIQKFHLLFITDQRLVVSDDRFRTLRTRATTITSRTAAELSAKELGRQMQGALSAYASESQRLDRDFPQRVVAAMKSDEEVPVERLQKLLRVVEQERVDLQKVGLLPRDLRAEAFQDLPLEDRNVRPVIETFIQDTRQKFAVLADLRDRLTLFVEFLNQHFENKRVVTQTRTGFRVEIDGNSDNAVEPSQLSSGEQQILVLAYEILFRSEPETLVLIDEPELSLHVLWQDTFIDDLTRMGNVRNLQFLLATHSPSLIGGRDDLKRSLDRVR